MSAWHDMFPDLLPGLWVTIKLTFFALVLGLPVGVLFATLSSAPSRWIRWPAIIVVEIGRGVPGLIVLYLVYRGLPQVDVVLTAFLSAVVGLGFSTAAYTAEIIRAGINAVPKGQREAAQALSLTPAQEFRLVVLPQALKTVVPPLIGFAIILYQGTSLAYAISVPELLSRAYNLASITFQFGAALSLAGVMYAVVSLTATALAGVRSRERIM
ncbi:amino acid ABC transporter permease [Micromonospora sp. NPDC005161]